MTDEPTRAAFRLNLKQQRKQAKDLLKGAKAADGGALARLARSIPDVPGRLRRGALRLADAQHAIARELRFRDWAGLKHHIESLDAARQAMQERSGTPPDSGMPTLHLRCGSDICTALAEAGFSGGFLEVSYPYCHGPATRGPGHLEREARYIADLAGKQMGVTYEGALQRRHEEEGQLAASTQQHERIVLWMEHDCFDQLVLVRCLAHYAATAAPRVLELVALDYFPGRRADGAPVHFMGLGQLPAEALRLLWTRRQPVTSRQLALATETWDALTRDDPTYLAQIMRSGAAALPHLASALLRFLRELPSVQDGLALTERLVLEILDEEPLPLGMLAGTLTHVRDPMFFATDLKLLQIVESMRTLAQPALVRTPVDGRWKDIVAITAVGRAVLRGERDWLSLGPPRRWVGGVEIRPGHPAWRWDDASRQPRAPG